MIINTKKQLFREAWYNLIIEFLILIIPGLVNLLQNLTTDC